MKLAIMQNGDTPELESTAVLLKHAGYDVKYCGRELRAELLRIGCDTVLGLETMYNLGYDRLDSSIGEAGLSDMERCDLFLEIKVRNIPKIWNRWPRLEKRTAYKRVNGAQPEICPKGGDEVNLPCPIITACLWYGTERYRHGKASQGQSDREHEASRPVTLEQQKAWSASAQLGDTGGPCYVFWPPYPRSADYLSISRERMAFGRRGDEMMQPSSPFCVCHSVRAWGYGGIISEVADMGVKFFGNNSPAGQIQHEHVPRFVATGLACVHMKSVDCPGWALYEALLGGCPVIVGRLLNSRMLAYDLLRHNETCLEFGVPATMEYGRGDPDLPKCLEDIQAALDQLKNPAENRRIGEAGRKRLNELMWRPDRDGDSFKTFMQRNFP